MKRYLVAMTLGPLKNTQFCFSSSLRPEGFARQARRAKIFTDSIAVIVITRIRCVFRGLKFEPNDEMWRKRAFFKVFIFFLAMVVVFQGCASRKEIKQKEDSALIQSKKKHIRNTLPTCFSQAECEEKWAAAKKWVTMDPRRKIKYYTDSFIETHEPSPDSSELAVQIVKEALPQGGYKFVITTKCYHKFGCHPSKWDAEIDFNQYINAGKKQKTLVSDEQPTGIETKAKDEALKQKDEVFKKAEELKGDNNLSLPDLPDKLTLPK